MRTYSQIPMPLRQGAMLRSKISTLEDLLRQGVRAENGCLIWPHAKDGAGYGRVHFDGRGWGVHRLTLSLVDGPLGKGVYACHTCDNPACFEPTHLFKGTALQNYADMERKGRKRIPIGNRSPRPHVVIPKRKLIPALQALLDRPPIK